MIDIEKLREEVMDYYGTAAASGFPMAIIELSQAESASDEKLISMAQKIGIDLRNYMV